MDGAVICTPGCHCAAIQHYLRVVWVKEAALAVDRPKFASTMSPPSFQPCFQPPFGVLVGLLDCRQSDALMDSFKSASPSKRTGFHTLPPPPLPPPQVPKVVKQVLEPGMWVRPRAGNYKDDLARVFEVEGDRASLQLVPRVDLKAMASRTEEDRKKNPFGRTAVRPPPRPFNPSEARDYGFQVSHDHAGFITMNTHR